MTSRRLPQESFAGRAVVGRAEIDRTELRLYPGEKRYPLAPDVEAIGLAEPCEEAQRRQRERGDCRRAGPPGAAKGV